MHIILILNSNAMNVTVGSLNAVFGKKKKKRIIILKAKVEFSVTCIWSTAKSAKFSTLPSYEKSKFN
jgi:hypothetical protein